MPSSPYLTWAAACTRTSWWHDSADPRELDLGLQRGCVGVTTNPFLSAIAVNANRQLWADRIREALDASDQPEVRAESLMRIAVTQAAQKLLPQFHDTEGRHGYVCAQVNPLRAGDRSAMLAMARRFHAWSPNIAVKLPATAAGLDVLEECVAEGITVAATVSFTVPQALAIARRHRAGLARAAANGRPSARCFAVLMVGRLDDYLREVADDNCADVAPADIQQAGIAVAKRSYAIYQENRYEATLLIAALRGIHHMTELVGGELIMSIFPSWQPLLMSETLPREERIQRPVLHKVIERLVRIPDFRRAYDPQGMEPGEFIGFGVTQRTLGQFADAGWKLLESFKA